MVVTRYVITDASSEYKFNTKKALNDFLATRTELADQWQQVQEIEPQPLVEVPNAVPLWCLRAVLRSMGLMQLVKEAIAAIPDEQLKIAAEEGFEYANTVFRNSATANFVKKSLQLTDEQVDSIFIEADKIEA